MAVKNLKPGRSLSKTPSTKRRGIKAKVIVHEAEEGGFWAEVPALPGCFTQGETRKELRANLREAIEGCLLAGSGLPSAADGQVEEIEL